MEKTLAEMVLELTRRPVRERDPVYSPSQDQKSEKREEADRHRKDFNRLPSEMRKTSSFNKAAARRS